MILEYDVGSFLPYLEAASVGFLAFGAKIRKEVIQRQGGKCYDCGEKARLQIHHRLPQSMGGEDILSNAVGLCQTCHKVADRLALRGHIFHERVHDDKRIS